MTASNDGPDEMDADHEPELTADLVDRLLSDGLAAVPGDPGLRVVATLVDAAKAPGGAGELDRLDADVASFRAALEGAAGPEADAGSSGKPVLAKVISLRTAAVAAVVVLSVGTAAAAATNNLPPPAQRVAHRAASAIGIPVPSPPRHEPKAELTAEQRSALDDCRAIAGPDGDAAAQARLAVLAASAGFTGDEAVDHYCASLRTAVETGKPAPEPTVPPAGSRPPEGEQGDGGTPPNGTEAGTAPLPGSGGAPKPGETEPTQPTTGGGGSPAPTGGSGGTGGGGSEPTGSQTTSSQPTSSQPPSSQPTGSQPGGSRPSGGTQPGGTTSEGGTSPGGTSGGSGGRSGGGTTEGSTGGRGTGGM